MKHALLALGVVLPLISACGGDNQRLVQNDESWLAFSDLVFVDPVGTGFSRIIEKDGKRFPDTGGWGYALFNYDAAADTFAPDGTGTGCGHVCHKEVAAKDYIFHPYQKR